MVRYFFNVVDGVILIDDIGIELPDMKAVQEQAVISAAEAIRELGSKFWRSEDWRLDVVDELGLNVLTLKFSGQSLEQAALPARPLQPAKAGVRTQLRIVRL